MRTSRRAPFLLCARGSRPERFKAAQCQNLAPSARKSCCFVRACIASFNSLSSADTVADYGSWLQCRATTLSKRQACA